MTKKETIPELTGLTQAQFTPQELTALAELIDIATRKGIFSAQDLILWGKLYQKTISYIPKGPQQ